MSNPELQAKNPVDTKEERLLQKEAEATDLSEHPDLMEMIAYKYAGRTTKENKDDPDGKDLYKWEVSEEDAKQVLAPFIRIASEPKFWVKFAEAATKANAPYEDILVIDELLNEMRNSEIDLVKYELQDLLETIESPDYIHNQYKNVAEFSEAQKWETRVTRLRDQAMNNREENDDFGRLSRRLESKRPWDGWAERAVVESIPGINKQTVDNIVSEGNLLRIDRKLWSDKRDTSREDMWGKSISLFVGSLTRVQEANNYNLSEVSFLNTPWELRKLIADAPKIETKERSDFPSDEAFSAYKQDYRAESEAALDAYLKQSIEDNLNNPKKVGDNAKEDYDLLTNDKQLINKFIDFHANEKAPEPWTVISRNIPGTDYGIDADNYLVARKVDIPEMNKLTADAWLTRWEVPYRSKISFLDSLQSITNMDEKSKSNMHNEVVMRWIENELYIDKDSNREEFKVKHEKELNSYIRGNWWEDREKMRKTWTNSQPVPKVAWLDDFYREKEGEAERNFTVALSNIQKEQNPPFELSKIPLFTVPWELRSFLKDHMVDDEETMQKSLKTAIDLSMKSNESLNKDWEQMTVEQLLIQRIPELSKKDQLTLQAYASMKHISEAWRNYGGATTKEGLSSTEGLKGLFQQIADIIKAIREGFADVWWDIASDPDMKAALAALNIVNVEEIDAMFLKKDWEIVAWDATSTINTALKKDLFNPNNSEDCLSNIFNEWANMSIVPKETTKEYIKNNKGTAGSPQEHILDTMLAVMHKDSAPEQKIALRDENGELNMNKVDGKYKEYKNHMIDTVWAWQNVRRKDMNEDQQKEMLSRSLVKNNSASLLYYKETVLPELQKLDTQKATDAAREKVNTETDKSETQ